MELTDRFCEALNYATRLHAAQRRKVDGTPYVAHLLRVCGIVLEAGGDEDEAIAALLHDAVEDQGGVRTGEEIRRRFGDRVAGIVFACSDALVTPKPPWRDRKRAYLARLRQESRSVCLVKVADKLDNVRSLLLAYRRVQESLWSHFKGGREGTLWYYRAAVAALREQQGGTLYNGLIDELDGAVTELERQCTPARSAGESP